MEPAGLIGGSNYNMAGVAQPSVPGPQGEIPATIDELEIAIGNMRDAYWGLVDRLSPVLDPTELKGDSAKRGHIPQTFVGGRLVSMIDQVNDMTTAIGTTKSKLGL